MCLSSADLHKCIKGGNRCQLIATTQQQPFPKGESTRQLPSTPARLESFKDLDGQLHEPNFSKPRALSFGFCYLPAAET